MLSRPIKIALVVFGLIYGLTHIPYVSIDPALAPYFNNFLDKVKKKCDVKDYYLPPQYFIKYSSLSDYTIGVCSRYGAGFTIDIDDKWWKTADVTSKEQLIAHESFHCLFGLGHSENSKNLMYYNIGPMTHEELEKQIEDILNEKCKTTK